MKRSPGQDSPVRGTNMGRDRARRFPTPRAGCTGTFGHDLFQHVQRCLLLTPRQITRLEICVSLFQERMFMLVSTKRPGDIIVLTVGDVQARVFIFRSRKRTGRILIGIEAPENVLIQQEHFQLQAEQAAAC